MAITHMRISQLPVRVDLDKNAVPAVLNASFPIGEQIQLVITNSTGFKSQNIDQFKYQVTEDEITWSNEGIVTIDDLADTNTPAAVNDTIAAIPETSYNPTSPDKFTLNSSVDRVKIVGLTTANGLLKYNGSLVALNSWFYVWQLSGLTFETLLGGLEPYQVIQYQVGNHLGYAATVYTLTVNVVESAEVEFISRTTNTSNVVIGPDTFAKTVVTDTIKIKKGYINKNALVNIDIASPMFGVGTNNEVYIDALVKTANENFNVTKGLNSSGVALMIIDHVFVDDTGTSSTSVVDFTLTQIDADPGKVSATNNYLSSVTFTSAGAGGGITDYRSSYEADGYVYSGWNDGGSPFIRRTKNGITTNATGLTSLEPDWINRLTLTYV